MSAGWTETLVARVAGVKKSLLANVRRDRLARGATAGAGDWCLDARQQVVYSRAGLMKLLTGLGLSMEEFVRQTATEAVPLDLPKEGQPDGGVSEIEALAGTGRASADATKPESATPATVADLVVVGVIGKKRLRARLPDGGIVALLVRASENFMPGMVCQGCRRAADRIGPWSFLGRPPRRKGRW